LGRNRRGQEGLKRKSRKPGMLDRNRRGQEGLGEKQKRTGRAGKEKEKTVHVR
jgi:hypothetical protein